MSDFKKKYLGKRVFVTGHTGFKGSWLIKILYDLGAVVKGYALAPENKINLYTAINGDSLCESVICDLRDKHFLIKEVLEFQPDFVFHLAAQPLVRLAYQIPSETFEVNSIGTANLLDAIRLLQKKCSIVLITTDKVYHNIESEYAYKESDRLGGYDPYSASKACCELIIESYKNSFFNTAKFKEHQKAIAVARAGNVIGGGDWSIDRLMPDIAKALHANKEVVIRSPKSIRPWQHVLEPLFGYLELGVKLDLNPMKYAQAYNFGPRESDALTVEEMVKTCIACWGFGSYIEKVSLNNPHESILLKLDISKALSQLNWKPIFSAEVAIERTVNWYKGYYSNVDALKLMESDIEYYKKRVNE